MSLLRSVIVLTCLALGIYARAEAPRQGVPSGCDPAVMSDAYWRIWNEAEQERIDADIEANRKADAAVAIDAPAGVDVTVEQLNHDFRFGAHIFNFNQLGKREYNDAYKASYGKGGIFNQATVAFYWNAYEPIPGKQRALGGPEDEEQYWNAMSFEEAQKHPYWRRPAPGPIIDFLKYKDVRVHGHILIWGTAKPYWIYDWYCPEDEKRNLDFLGLPRHSDYAYHEIAGTGERFGYQKPWSKAWARINKLKSEREIAAVMPGFAANMWMIFRKRVLDVGRDFGTVVDSWDVVNESCGDWQAYRKARTGLPVWKSDRYGIMPGDYPLHALLDAKEAMRSTADLCINDWIVGEDFRTQVRQLESEGAKIDVVGCQMHIFNTNDCMRLARGATNVNWVGTPQVIQSRLDTMAETGRPIHVSEITITSPGADASSRQMQAILTRNIYRKWFSHKATAGITWWNTVDGGGVYGEPLVSGLFTRDMKRKPAYDALDELINREWMTKTTVRVSDRNGGGLVVFRGFRGRYRLSWACTTCGRRHVREVFLTGDGINEKASALRCPDEMKPQPVRSYSVDGQPVSLRTGDVVLDLTSRYPQAVIRGEEGKRWAEVSCTLVAPEPGEYQVFCVNDYYGRLLVNGEDRGEMNGPEDADFPNGFTVKLHGGTNHIALRTRAGTGGAWRVGFFLPYDSPLRVPEGK